MEIRMASNHLSQIHAVLELKKRDILTMPTTTPYTAYAEQDLRNTHVLTRPPYTYLSLRMLTVEILRL